MHTGTGPEERAEGLWSEGRKAAVAHVQASQAAEWVGLQHAEQRLSSSYHRAAPLMSDGAPTLGPDSSGQGGVGRGEM